MRQLLPHSFDEVVCYDAYRPEDPHAPMVRLDMVASADGKATDARGRTGGLAGSGDLEVFRALRALADGILAGAGTVRTEDYGAHRVDRSVADLRRADGRDRPAPMIVVSASLELDPGARIFAEAVTPTIVLTCEAAPTDRRAALERVARVIVAGERAVDFSLAVGTLRAEHGINHLLVEGGPTVNGQLFGANAVDELCLTIASQLVGGVGPGIITGLPVGKGLGLVSLLADDRDLFARYRVLP